MSSKGQVVIPNAVRDALGLQSGMQFVVVGQGDCVILKTIKPPDMTDFNLLIRKAREQARLAGLKRSDITEAIAQVRGRK
jgi:AbrB family looped-hinge helix DNA binding protein